MNVLSKLKPVLGKLQNLVSPILTQVRSRLPDSISGKLSDAVLTAILFGAISFLLVLGFAWLSPSPSASVAYNPDAQPISAEETEGQTTPPPQPEQSVIDAIQDQVAEVTDAYADGLIQSVKANFRSNLLIVTAGEAWYGLEPNRQDDMANELWRRSQELDFSHLNLIDPDDVMVARSPVVGQRMVILQR
ncbi:MAG: hypothetical protein QNJ46_33580 [Leptolyngbyaceae cyanobacterium MO_188.B28]|nr:hypothetical protein [Leptolyngbyaceae cyanobacterium MO_188.B28]